MDPTRLKDTDGDVYCWENPNGNETVEISDDTQTVDVDTPYGSPDTGDCDFSFDQFRKGFGQDYVRARFGDIVVQEIIEALPGVTGSRREKSRATLDLRRDKRSARIRRR